MAGPSKQVVGEVIRPRFNVYTLLDHALGSYERGYDGLYYLNGGFAHIMAFAGRGNTFKSTLLDFMLFQIKVRYEIDWASDYDTEMSKQIDRLQTILNSALIANGLEPNSITVIEMIDSGVFNLCGSDVLPGEEYYASYIRDEVESRFKQYAQKKNIRETVFIDPIRKTLKAILDPWFYAIDSLSEFHTSKLEEKHSKTKVGDADQNILNANDTLQKANMLGRWPAATARGHMYMGFVMHLADDQMGAAMKSTNGRPQANAKLLDDLAADMKFAGVPKRAVSFLTNSLLVATKAGECKHDYDSKLGVNTPKYPTNRGRGMLSASNDLKEITFRQFRAKGGPTGVVVKLIFTQEGGFQYHLSLWNYLKDLPDESGYTTAGNNYRLSILPDVSFGRTTVRDTIDENPRLRRALEITAGAVYYINNKHTLPDRYRISMDDLYVKIKEKGWDWDEILDNTVEYWKFKDQYDRKGEKGTITSMTLLAMAVDDDCVPKFLTRKK